MGGCRGEGVGWFVPDAGANQRVGLAAEELPVPLVIDAADGVAMDRYSAILPFIGAAVAAS